jgi:protein required for attachment to host cells
VPGAEVEVRHWVLIVDAASSSLYATDELFSEFSRIEHETAKHAAHAHPTAGGNRDPHASDRARFAHAVAHHLDAAALAGDYDRLVVVAPPRFMGEIRKDLSPRVHERVVAWVPHDLGHTPIRELPHAVRRHLPDTAGMEG